MRPRRQAPLRQPRGSRSLRYWLGHFGGLRGHEFPCHCWSRDLRAASRRRDPRGAGDEKYDVTSAALSHNDTGNLDSHDTAEIRRRTPDAARIGDGVVCNLKNGRACGIGFPRSQFAKNCGASTRRPGGDGKDEKSSKVCWLSRLGGSRSCDSCPGRAN